MLIAVETINRVNVISVVRKNVDRQTDHVYMLNNKDSYILNLSLLTTSIKLPKSRPGDDVIIC